MRNFSAFLALVGMTAAGITAFLYMLHGGKEPQVSSALTNAEDKLILVTQEWCMTPDVCTAWVHNGVVQVIPMRNRQAVRAIEIKLPSDSQIANIGSAMCGYENCELTADDKTVTFRKYGRDAVTFVRNKDGQYSAHVLAAATPGE